MLFHASIPADDPERVARVIAELWRGQSMPFPPQSGAYIVFGGDERCSVLEAVPRGQEQFPSPGEVTTRSNPNPSFYSEVHLAVGASLSAEEILAIGKREGWMAQRSDRGGLFSVVELWVENRFLLEVLTEAEQQRYAANLTPESFRALFGVAA